MNMKKMLHLIWEIYKGIALGIGSAATLMLLTALVLNMLEKTDLYRPGPSVETIERFLYIPCRHLDIARPIWIEDRHALSAQWSVTDRQAFIADLRAAGWEPAESRFPDCPTFERKGMRLRICPNENEDERDSLLLLPIWLDEERLPTTPTAIPGAWHLDDYE